MTDLTKPQNPFILPALDDDQIVYAETKLKSAASLAAHYIAARAAFDSEMSRTFDGDIGAFISEDFGADDQEECAFFATRFATLIEQCDKAYPLQYHRCWLRPHHCPYCGAPVPTGDDLKLDQWGYFHCVELECGARLELNEQGHAFGYINKPAATATS